MKLPLSMGFDKVDPIHFYCIQVYTDHGAMHFHAPLDHILTDFECHHMAQDILKKGGGNWGDDPAFSVGFQFNPAKLVGVMVEHKLSYSRTEFAEEMAKECEATDPLTRLFGGLGRSGGNSGGNSGGHSGGGMN